MTWDGLTPPYRTIVADPPWRYASAATKADARKHYSTMPLADICAMPVEDLADESCHLWLWATNGLMEDAYKVVRAWGFSPLTIVTWCKPRPGVGYYLRNNTEHAILASRGRPMVPAVKPLATWWVWRAGGGALGETRCVLRPRGAGVTRAAGRAVRPGAAARVGFVGLRLRAREEAMTTTDAEFGVFCPGILDVLSIGKGDLRLSVGDSDEDREKARALIEEMLEKGYAIFVETDTGPERVVAFNPARMTYLIQEVPEPAEADPEAAAAPQPRKQKRKGRTRPVPVAGSRATAVGRTSGG